MVPGDVAAVKIPPPSPLPPSIAPQPPPSDAPSSEDKTRSPPAADCKAEEAGNTFDTEMKHVPDPLLSGLVNGKGGVDTKLEESAADCGVDNVKEEVTTANEEEESHKTSCKVKTAEQLRLTHATSKKLDVSNSILSGGKCSKDTNGAAAGGIVTTLSSGGVDIFRDKNIELLNVRWVTEGLLVDGGDGTGWKVVTSNRIVLDNDEEDIVVPGGSSRSTKHVREGNNSWRSSNNNSWNSNNIGSWSHKDGVRRPGGGPAFIDGSSGFANGMSTSLADIHRSIGSGAFLINRGCHNNSNNTLDTCQSSTADMSHHHHLHQDPLDSTTNHHHLTAAAANNNGCGGGGGQHNGTPAVSCLDESDEAAAAAAVVDTFKSSSSTSEVNSLGVDMMQIEIDPVALLASAIEEDQRSANPVIPTEHFLLGQCDPGDGEGGGGGGEGGWCVEGGGGEGEEDLESAVMGYATGGGGMMMPMMHNQYHGYGSSPDDVMMMNSLSGGGAGGVVAGGGYSEAGVFQCDICSKAFKYQYLLLNHRRHVHSIITKPNSQSSINKKIQFQQQQLSGGSYQSSLLDSANGGGGILSPEHQPDDGTEGGAGDTQHGSSLDMSQLHPSLALKMSTGLVVNGQVFCPVCGKKFLDRASLVAHSVQHM